ncbi:hypothetical protein LCGC14_2761300, partial [marine sediment metagenome]
MRIYRRLFLARMRAQNFARNDGVKGQAIFTPQGMYFHSCQSEGADASAEQSEG